MNNINCVLVLLCFGFLVVTVLGQNTRPPCGSYSDDTWSPATCNETINNKGIDICLYDDHFRRYQCCYACLVKFNEDPDYFWSTPAAVLVTQQPCVDIWTNVQSNGKSYCENIKANGWQGNSKYKCIHRSNQSYNRMIAYSCQKTCGYCDTPMYYK